MIYIQCFKNNRDRVMDAFVLSGYILKKTIKQFLSDYSPMIFNHSPMDFIYWRMLYGAYSVLFVMIEAENLSI